MSSTTSLPPAWPQPPPPLTPLSLIVLSALCRYYEGGVSSVYLWTPEETKDQFAGVVLLKKGQSATFQLGLLGSSYHDLRSTQSSTLYLRGHCVKSPSLCPDRTADIVWLLHSAPCAVVRFVGLDPRV